MEGRARTAALRAEDVIDLLELLPLPGEGGYFRQTWATPATVGSGEPDGTAILYLVTPESWSALHRLDTDELFHFYLGDPCDMVMVDGAGSADSVRLGPDIAAGERIQHLVPGGWWQGTRLATGGSWALLGTTMTPGYHSGRFELATRQTVAEFLPTTRRSVEAYLAPAP